MSAREDDVDDPVPVPNPEDPGGEPLVPMEAVKPGLPLHSDSAPPVGPEPVVRSVWSRMERREAIAWIAAFLVVALVLVVAFRRKTQRPVIPETPSQLVPPAPPLPDDNPPEQPHGPASEPERSTPGTP